MTGNDKPGRQTGRRTLHGRRKGRPLTAYRAGLVKDLLAERAIDLASAAPTNLTELFPAGTESVRLEIGFGAGDHLAWQAAQAPTIGFIGVEPFINGMAAMLARIAEKNLANIRLFDRDAAELLDWLPDRSVAEIDILYPDPWPKRRHWKRRVVSAANLEKIARVIPAGGTLRLATDWPDYANWMLWHVLKNGHFDWPAETAADWRNPWPDWPSTRYEQKALAAGRKPTYLVFVRR